MGRLPLSDGNPALEGQVLWGARNIYMVQVPRLGEGQTYECRLKGKKLRLGEEAYNPLAPGDFVEIEVEGDSLKGMILDRAARTNSVERWNRKKELSQTLAANMDVMCVVASTGLPPFRPRFVDRCLALAEWSSVEVLIIVNKVDMGLEDEDGERILAWSRAGYPVHLCSAVSGEGIPELKEMLSGLAVLFMGQSGVGKSSLLRVLEPSIDTRVGELNQKYDRGNHTTTLARAWPSSFARSLVDTPGIRQLELPAMADTDMAFLFKEFVPLIRQCRLRNCTHREEPGCAVRQAFQEGTIHPDRYDSYRRIIDARGD